MREQSNYKVFVALFLISGRILFSKFPLFSQFVKMKLFETVLNNFAIVGMTPSKHRFNTKIAMAFVLIGTATLFHILHIFFVASNLKERTQSSTTTSGSLVITICFLTVIFKMRAVFNCIRDFEDIIAMSESIYSELIRNSI